MHWSPQFADEVGQEAHWYWSCWLMYTFRTKESKNKTDAETRLHSPKCVDEVSSPNLPLAHEVVATLETLNLEQTSHRPIYSSFEWTRFTVGKLLQTHCLAHEDMTWFLVTEFWHLEVIKFRGNKHTCLLNFLLLWSRTTAPLRLKLVPFPDIQSSTDRTSYTSAMNF
jgi:hypothetical protein